METHEVSCAKRAARHGIAGMPTCDRVDAWRILTGFGADFLRLSQKQVDVALRKLRPTIQKIETMKRIGAAK